MRPREGFKLKVCPRCQRKRHCWITASSAAEHTWICSQSHLWHEDIPTIENVTKILKEIYKDTITLFLGDDSPFYRRIP